MAVHKVNSFMIPITVKFLECVIFNHIYISHLSYILPNTSVIAIRFLYFTFEEVIKKTETLAINGKRI